jgi:hypothetical protein
VDVVQSDPSANDPGRVGFLDALEELRFNICVNGVPAPGQTQAASPTHCNTPDEDVSTFCRPLPAGPGAPAAGAGGTPPPPPLVPGDAPGTGGGAGGGGAATAYSAAASNMNGLVRNCQTQLLQIAASELHSVCCTGAESCASGYPLTCTADCALLWAPFAQSCSTYVGEIFPELTPFTAQCEAQAYGAERCDVGYYQQQLGTVATQCCGANGENCDAATSALPSSCNHTAACAPTYEGFYARCRPRVEGLGHQRLGEFSDFLATCQSSYYIDPFATAGVAPPDGGGH